MRYGVVVFPGSNCDMDCFYAVGSVLKQPVSYLWHKETDLSGYDCIILPGGFSYGDYLRAGAVARMSPVMNAVRDFAEKGGRVLGICNGFQILLEAGLLPGAMLRNGSLHFICRFVYVRCSADGRVLRMPIAHNEGSYYYEKGTLSDSQIILRYCSPGGEVSMEFNPNGAMDNIAGICNKKRNVFGMMPHPERCVEDILGSSDGRYIFEELIK